MATGTATAVLGQTQTLTTISAAGAYVLKLNKNIAIGDELHIESFTKVLVGSTSARSQLDVFTNLQAEPNLQTDPLEIDHELIYKLRHVKGTMTITSMTGTVSVGDTVTGATSGATGIVTFMDVPATPTSIRIRVTSDGTAFQDAENAEIDGSNYLVLNDATPAVTFEWTSTEL